MNADYALGRPNAYKTCRCFAMKLRVSRSARATDRRASLDGKSPRAAAARVTGGRIGVHRLYEIYIFQPFVSPRFQMAS